MFSTFCDSLWLFKRSKGAIYPITTIPDDAVLSEQYQYVCLNSFPFISLNGKSETKEKMIEDDGSVFVFNREDGKFCYAWTFKSREDEEHKDFTTDDSDASSSWYSIIVVGNFAYPKIYFDLFAEAKKEMNLLEKNINPLNRFGMVFSLIQTWTLNDNYIDFHYPSQNFKRIPLTKSLKCFGDFDPSKVFSNSKTNFILLWKSLLTGSPVNIISDKPENLGYATFAACSLVSPFVYRDSILITYNEADPRLAHASDYSIVATTSRISAILNQRKKFTVSLSPKNVDLKKSNFEAITQNVVLKSLLQRNKRLQKLSLFVMDRALLVNPYNDLLNYPFVTDDLDSEMGVKGSINEFMADDLRKFEKTKTLQEWRKSVVYRDSLRSAFLSIEPEIALRGKSRQHLKIIYKLLNNMEKLYETDAHLLSVIKRHKKFIKQLFKNSMASSCSEEELDECTIIFSSSSSYDDGISLVKNGYI